MMRMMLAVWLILGFESVGGAAELPPSVDRQVDFAKDVKPLLTKHCASCHGSRKQESGLRLDSRAAMLKGGDQGIVVTPGKSADSRLIHYVAAVDPKNVMPPEGDPLSAEAVGVLRAWIDHGCIWPDSESTVAKNGHWAYQPLKNVAPPAVNRMEWVSNPIDQFVLAELQKRNLTPSPMADRYTLIRRAYLDLLGLLPTIAEVDAFVNDARPNAYEALLDRLLQSPHFGERWGRHWLDVARYADSDGYEKDNPRPDAYRWRDWVIDAINADMPFDQFTIEQLAGDLLPDATPMQKLATAFHRQTLTNTEGGTDQEQFRVEACFDRTETTGAAWLGLTIGCARCHTHKYDAISQREYYQLFAVFNNGDEQSTIVPKSPEEIAAYGPLKAAHDAAVEEAVKVLKAEQARQMTAYAAWEAKTQEQQLRAASNPVKQHLLEEPRYTADSELSFQPQADGSVLVSGNNPEKAVYTIVGRTSVAEINALRLDVLPDPSLPANGPGRVAHGNFVLSEMTVEAASNPEFSDARKLEFAGAKADFEQADKPWRAINVIDGKDETGWAIAPQFGKPHWAVFGLKEPLVVTAATYVRVQLSQQYGVQHTIGRFKVSMQSGIEPGTSLPDPIAKLFAIAADKRNDAQKQQLVDYYSSLESPTRELLSTLEELRKKEPPKPELNVRVIGQRTKDPRQTFVLKRGEFLDPLKDLSVEPAGLATLPPLKPRGDGMADRLDMARWLVSSDNPLTPRVTVNHVWRLLFGAGIVRTSNDFGVRGEPPTHPELLDWLATEFIGVGKSPIGRPWSRKALIKRIMMSSTYRQASQHRAELDDVDPQNMWLARQNRLRVEAEIVRDECLQVAGLLSPKIGGPSVFPPLPPGIAELSYAGNFKWTTSTGEDRYRRGMYTFFKRTAPHPNLTMFDCPDANLTCIERRTSNTPLQALMSLNNETFSETSRAFAKRLLATPSADDNARLSHGFRLCVARPPQEPELTALSGMLQESREWYRSRAELAAKFVGPDAAPGISVDENAAWIATARILINLDEFITRE
ncbi:MAG: PSD1 domain-containing protein [Planctomycetes bacterium]|nr:PSD1 domain-containing protein [Planctomycetota bacterium]